jgi:hypothetical protein
VSTEFHIGVFPDIPFVVRDALAAKFQVRILSEGTPDLIDLDAIVTGWWRGFSAADAVRYPMIRYVSVHGVGSERIEVDRLTAAGVGFGTTYRDGTDHAVAECAIARSALLS